MFEWQHHYPTLIGLYIYIAPTHRTIRHWNEHHHLWWSILLLLCATICCELVAESQYGAIKQTDMQPYVYLTAASKDND